MISNVQPLLYSLAGNGDYWLGGSDSAVEGDWKWLDGSDVPMGPPFWGSVSITSLFCKYVLRQVSFNNLLSTLYTQIFSFNNY